MAKNRESAVARKASKAKATEAEHETGSLVASMVSVDSGQFHLSAGEVSILAVFRKYLMTPGRMLCLNNTDLGTMKRSLEKLTASGLLVPEDFKGSYSLTRSGFQAMNELS